MKSCSQCAEVKTLDLFHFDNRSSDGLRSMCKACQNAINAKWKVRNREKQAAYSAKYTSKNLHKHAEKESRRRARLQNTARYLVTEKDLKRLLSGGCFYCGETRKLTLDHVIPLIRGGSHGIGNLVGACSACNSRKQRRLVMEWQKMSKLGAWKNNVSDVV